jgi:hypothetical protein
MIAVYNKGILSWDQCYQKDTCREFYVEGNAVTQIDNLIKKFAFLIKCSLTLFLTLIHVWIYAVIAQDNLQKDLTSTSGSRVSHEII